MLVLRHEILTFPQSKIIIYDHVCVYFKSFFPSLASQVRVMEGSLN